MPAVTWLNGGTFAVAWVDRSGALPGSGYDIRCRVFNSSGVGLTNDILVNGTLTSGQTQPAIAALPAAAWPAGRGSRLLTPVLDLGIDVGVVGQGDVPDAGKGAGLVGRRAAGPPPAAPANEPVAQHGGDGVIRVREQRAVDLVVARPRRPGHRLDLA